MATWQELKEKYAHLGDATLDLSATPAQLKEKYAAEPQEDRGMAREALGSFGYGAQTTMGAPVDIVTAGLNKLLPQSAQITEPVGGSAWLHRMTGGWRPQGVTGTIAAALGEQAPGLIAGPAMQAAKGAPLIQRLSPLTPRVAPTAPAVEFGKTVAKMTPSAVGAGVGVGAARTVAPDNMAVELVTAILGGGTTATLTNKLINPNLNKVINSELRAIVPTVSAKKQGLSGKELFNYNRKNQEATKAVVVSNRQEPFSYVDESGSVAHTGLPRDRFEFAQAVDQVKTRIYKNYNAMLQAAGKKGLSFNGDTLMQEINNAYDPAIHPDLAPSVTGKYAKDHAAQFYAGKQLSPEQIENELKEVNARIYAHSKSQQPGDVSKFSQDQVIARVLRDALDNGVSGFEGEGYNQFRNQYANVRNLQDTVARAAVKQFNDDVKKGALTQAEGYWLMEAIVGTGAAVAAGKPGVAATNLAISLGVPGIRRYWKHMHDPDVRLQKLFKTVDRHLETPQKFYGSGAKPELPPSAASQATPKIEPPPPTGPTKRAAKISQAQLADLVNEYPDMTVAELQRRIGGGQ